MAGADRMTIEEVVKRVLLDEHADVIREAVKAVAAEMMELEVSELIGAELGSVGPRIGRRSATGIARGVGHARGRDRAAIPKIRHGSYFPSFFEPRRRSEQALLAVVQQAYVCGVSTRRVNQLVESLGLRISKSEVSRVCQALDEHVDAFRTRPLEGRYPTSSWTRRWRSPRRRPRREQGARDRPRRARDRPPRDPLDRCRRGRDRSVLDRVPARLGQARPRRRPARRQRRARRSEGGDREGPRLCLAALHRPFPARLLRACPQGPARPARRADPADLRRREARPGARPALRSCRPSRRALRKIATMLEDAEADILAFYAFPISHWRKLRSTNPLERFNNESAGAPTSSASSPTTAP